MTLVNRIPTNTTGKGPMISQTPASPLQRSLVLDTARRLLFRPYSWAGASPETGFDCSGLVCEALQSAGILPRKGDLTANGLMERCPQRPRGEDPQAGDLYFRLKGGVAVHVEIIEEVLSPKFYISIGASGGGPDVRTIEDAIKANAFIKRRRPAMGDDVVLCRLPADITP